MCCCLSREIEMYVLSSGMAALTPRPSQTTEINWDLLEELPENASHKMWFTGRSWDYREEYCLSSSVSMAVHLGTGTGIFRRTQSKRGKETTTVLLSRESLSQSVDFNATISTCSSCP